MASALLNARDQGLVKFGDDSVNPSTRSLQDGATARYLKDIVNAGEGDLPMRPALARVLDRMLSAAEQRRKDGAIGVDFTIMSLHRPDKGPSPHAQGAAVDLGMYAGQKIGFMLRESSVKAVVQFYKDMLGGDGHFGTPVDAKIAFGLPRNPRMDPVGALAEYNDSGHPEKQRYYDIVPVKGGVISQRPYAVANVRAELKAEYLVPDTFFHREQPPNSSPTGHLRSDIALLRPEAKQALEPLGERDRGPTVRYMFPDGLDHLHVQVVK